MVHTKKGVNLRLWPTVSSSSSSSSNNNNNSNSGNTSSKNFNTSNSSLTSRPQLDRTATSSRGSLGSASSSRSNRNDNSNNVVDNTFSLEDEERLISMELASNASIVRCEANKIVNKENLEVRVEKTMAAVDELASSIRIMAKEMREWRSEERLFRHQQHVERMKPCNNTTLNTGMSDVIGPGAENYPVCSNYNDKNNIFDGIRGVSRLNCNGGMAGGRTFRRPSYPRSKLADGSIPSLSSLSLSSSTTSAMSTSERFLLGNNRKQYHQSEQDEDYHQKYQQHVQDMCNQSKSDTEQERIHNEYIRREGMYQEEKPTLEHNPQEQQVDTCELETIVDEVAVEEESEDEEEDDDDDDDDDDDMDRKQIRLDGLEVYAVVSAATAGTLVAAFQSYDPGDLVGLYRHGRYVDVMFGIVFLALGGIGILCGVHSILVFSLTTMYGRTALGMGRDDALDTFFRNTAGQRLRGFQSFTWSLYAFVVELAIVITEKVPMEFRIMAFVLSVTVVTYIVYNDTQGIIEEAAVIFKPPALPPSKPIKLPPPLSPSPSPASLSSVSSSSSLPPPSSPSTKPRAFSMTSILTSATNAALRDIRERFDDDDDNNSVNSTVTLNNYYSDKDHLRQVHRTKFVSRDELDPRAVSVPRRRGRGRAFSKNRSTMTLGAREQLELQKLQLEKLVDKDE